VFLLPSIRLTEARRSAPVYPVFAARKGERRLTEKGEQVRRMAWGQDDAGTI